jgi:hypothetical protein
MKKTETKKSRATVPLKVQLHEYLGEFIETNLRFTVSQGTKWVLLMKNKSKKSFNSLP